MRLGPGPLAPTSYSANTPLYIEHGFACDMGNAVSLADQISATAGFYLDLDGVRQPSTVDVNFVNGALSKL